MTWKTLRVLTLVALGGVGSASAKPPPIEGGVIQIQAGDTSCKDPKSKPRCMTDDASFDAYLKQKNLKGLKIPPEDQRANDSLCPDGGEFWNYIAKGPQNGSLKGYWNGTAKTPLDQQKIQLRNAVNLYQCVDDAFLKVLSETEGPYVDLKKAFAIVSDQTSDAATKVANVKLILAKTGNPLQELARLNGSAPTPVQGAAGGGKLYVDFGKQLYDFSKTPQIGFDFTYTVVPGADIDPIDGLEQDTLDLDDPNNKDFNLNHMAALWIDDAACNGKDEAPALCWYPKEKGKKIRSRFDEVRKWLNMTNEFVRTASSTTPSVAALAGHCPPAWATKWVHTEDQSDTGCPHDGTIDNLGALLALQQAAPPPQPKGNVGAPGVPTDVAALEDRIKRNTLTKMGLDQYFDNSTPGVSKLKADTPPDKAAQIQAIVAGKLQNQGGNMSFVFTAPQSKQAVTVPVAPNAATDQAGVDSASDGIKAALLADKPGVAVAQGVAAAVTGNVPPGPAVTGGPAGTTTVGAGANVGAGGGGQVASLLGPGTVVGTAGCGSPGGVPQSTADAGAASAASRSAARQKATAPAAAPVAAPVDAGSPGTGVVPGPVGTPTVGGQ